MEELVKRVSDFVEMEHRSGAMQLISAEYVARCMQIAKEDAAAALEALATRNYWLMSRSMDNCPIRRRRISGAF